MLLVMGYLRVRNADIARLRGPIDRQVRAVREFHGCEGYAFGIDLLEPDLLRVAERWRTRAAQSAHLVGDHMVEFNIGMRAANVVATSVDSYEAGVVRRLLQIPATSFRPEREDREMAVVMGSVHFASGEIDRIRPRLEAHLAEARAEEGCDLYAFSRDLLDVDVLHIAGRWRTGAALVAHLNTPAMAAFNTELDGATLESMAVSAYYADGQRALFER